MAVPKAEDILSMNAEKIPAFILDQTNAKTLSGLMRRLNDDLLNGDETASEMAGKALNRLGFNAQP